MLLYIVEGGRQLGHGLVEADVLENLRRKINSYIKYSYTHNIMMATKHSINLNYGKKRAFILTNETRLLALT